MYAAYTGFNPHQPKVPEEDEFPHNGPRDMQNLLLTVLCKCNTLLSVCTCTGVKPKKSAGDIFCLTSSTGCFAAHFLGDDCLELMRLIASTIDGLSSSVNNKYELNCTTEQDLVYARDGVLEDWPRPRGQNFVALVLASNTPGLDDARP